MTTKQRRMSSSGMPPRTSSPSEAVSRRPHGPSFLQQKPQTLVDGETMGRSDREKEIRAAIERIFEGGCPSSLIIIADMTGRQTVRTQCVGAVADLKALIVNGVPQCIDMIDNAAASADGRAPAKFDS